MARRTPIPPTTGACRLVVQRTMCAACGTALHVAHLTQRTIRRLDGVWRLTMPLMRCLNRHCLRFRKLCRPEEEGSWAFLLREVQALIPVPITGPSPMGKLGIAHAVSKVFPTLPHQLCQYHYLREAAKPIYEADRHTKKDLQALVRDIRPVERLMEGVLAHQPGITPAYRLGLSEEEARIVQGYCLAVRGALTDDGYPPLCAAGLRLQERLTKIAASLQSSMQKGAAIGAWSTRWSGFNVPSSVA